MHRMVNIQLVLADNKLIVYRCFYYCVTGEGDYNTVFLGLYKTGILTAIKLLTVFKKKIADLTTTTPLTYYF